MRAGILSVLVMPVSPSLGMAPGTQLALKECLLIVDKAMCVTIKTMGRVPVLPPGSGGRSYNLVQIGVMCGHVRCVLGWQVHMGVMCVPISEAVNPGMKAMGSVCGPYRVRGRWLQVYNLE